MGIYKRILVAIDLTDEAPEVLGRAQTIAQNNDAELLLMHVIEPVGYAYGGDIPMDLSELQNQLDASARKQLAEYGKRFDVEPSQHIIAVGRPSSEIHRAAEEHNADLVVVGSHGRSGIQLLLGSTANGVLHGSKCDVLAVRIH
ncbi:universal stress protein [Mangrovitalea sediminis]|uniref:universal stress protein n=1 Tax=Mangrovitalea sediminis TaxID=1982043 RepID=UPI000BE5D6BB|nr:universal stress protein [Mangrovitalea sediminis]